MSGYRGYKPRPVTLFCNECGRPYDLVALTEKKRGVVRCPHCNAKIGTVS